MGKPESDDHTNGDLLDGIRHLLPSQLALKDFIHHNPLHSFQHLCFFDAAFEAADILGIQAHLPLDDYRALHQSGRIRTDILRMVVGRKHADAGLWEDRLLNRPYDEARRPRIGRLRRLWKDACAVDLDNLVHPLLFRVLCAYLDQGIALTAMPLGGNGLLESLSRLERESVAGLFRTREVRRIFLSGDYSRTGLLDRIVGDASYHEQYLFDMHFSHPGWSGFVQAVERHPETLLDRRPISLSDATTFELLLELDALHATLGRDWRPISEKTGEPPADIRKAGERTEYSRVVELWQEAFEWSYYDAVLKGLQRCHTRRREATDGTTSLPAESDPPGEPSQPSRPFQAVFCIDERECSIRRHLEAIAPRCETFGAPGFFGVEFYFLQQGSRFPDKLCPAPVTPAYLIRETDARGMGKSENLYRKGTHGFLRGIAYSLSLGYLAAIRMLRNLYRPKMSPAISNAFGHMDADSRLTIESGDTPEMSDGLQVGYTVEEMTARAEGFLRGIGLVDRFAPLVYIVAHGSSSANNPHHGAHDCGACSGRPGAVNARVQAHILNHPRVREALSARGIHIPAGTRFIAAMHDTAADVVGYYDDRIEDDRLSQLHRAACRSFETALDLNAKERSRRFASIDTRQERRKVRKAIHDRSVSLFEPRPELGHGTNTLAIIGRRSLTRKLFLDRRAFLNSYDPDTDPDGDILTAVMRPIGLVCGGINLEYYFSRTDNVRMGAGTKLPHNVMGLFGVANSSDGDLRPGLPWQMIEVHDPVRLLVIVEQRPEIVLKAVTSSPQVHEWYRNEWVHLMAMDPSDGSLHRYREGAFEPYEPLTRDDEIGTIRNVEALLETAREMETNHILHATEENLPVYMLE